jgi:hypothetical protein
MCRNQFLSFGLMDNSTYFSSRSLFSQLWATKLCASACSICTSAGEAFFHTHADVADYSLHYPVSPSIPLCHIAMCHHIATVLYLMLQQQNLIQLHVSYNTVKEVKKCRYSITILVCSLTSVYKIWP